MIKHIVFFRFKAGVPESDRQAFVEMLKALPAKISEIVGFEAGANVLASARAYDVALVASYANLAALERYAKHEHHQPVIQRSHEICEQTASVDFEY